MTEIYDRIKSSLPGYSEGRPDYCSEVFWFAKTSICEELDVQADRDIIEDLECLPAGMTTRVDRFYSQFTLWHVVDQVAASLMLNPLDDSVVNAARAVLACNTGEGFDEAKPMLAWLGDIARASEMEERMIKMDVGGHRAWRLRVGHYMKLFQCVDFINQMIASHEKSHFALVGAAFGFLVAGRPSPMNYAKSRILPYFALMRQKGLQYE
jgi:hypothetical protein